MDTKELDKAIVVLGDLWPEYLNQKTIVGRETLKLLNEVSDLRDRLKKAEA